MIVLGVDPGQSGAIVRISQSGAIECCKLCDTEREISDWLFTVGNPCHAFIERVAARPGQGVSSMFKFGQGYGTVRGLLTALRIPFEEVTPQKWQKEMGCLSKGDKRVTRARAQQLFPNVKVTHSIADALLIAEWGRRQLALRSHAVDDKISGADGSRNLSPAPSTTRLP